MCALCPGVGNEYKLKGYYYISFFLDYATKGSCLTSKEEETQMEIGLYALTQVRKMTCKVKTEENNTFTKSFAEEISRDKD